MDMLASYPIECTDTLDSLVANWLQAKGSASGTSRTRTTYQEMLRSYRAALQRVGLELDSEPAAIAPVAQRWAAARMKRGRGEVSPATYNQRLACVSSFYVYAIRTRRLDANPIALVERRHIQTYAHAEPLDMAEVKRKLAQIDRSTAAGMRDHALLSVGLITGRRLSELAGLRWGDVKLAGQSVTLTFRCKGNKVMRDTLPMPVGQVLLTYLQTIYPRLATMPPDTPVWVSFGRQNKGGALSIQAIADICEHNLGTSKVHALRHTFARAMLEQGAAVTEIQRRLGHGNLATTQRYLEALESADNPYSEQLAVLLGLE
jgi:integrase/recombinase XerD